MLVGHVACLGHGGGGHTSWHSRTSDVVVYGSPLNSRGGNMHHTLVEDFNLRPLDPECRFRRSQVSGGIPSAQFNPVIRMRANIAEAVAAHFPAALMRQTP